MKFECQTKNIKDAISKVQKIITKNATNPILSSILIQTTDHSVIFRSNNLHIGIEVEIPGKIEEKGEFLVSGEVFSQVLLSLPEEGPLVLSLKGGLLEIHTKKNAIAINSSGDPSDFPTLPKVSDESQSVKLSLDNFMQGIRSVYHCASISDIKPEISSVYIFSSDNDIVFVSTDSFRLAEKRVQQEDLPLINGILIPYKNVLELLKLFSDSSGELTLLWNENQINFSIPGIFVSSRIVNGSYPNYSTIIPKTFKTETIALKKDILNSLKLSTIFSDKFNQIQIAINAESKNFVMKGKNTQKGETVSSIDATINGESLEFNFNYRYFSEAFNSIPTDSVIIQCNEENKPVVIRGVGDLSFLYLIMPMNR